MIAAGDIRVQSEGLTERSLPHVRVRYLAHNEE